jgi:hypothetical protein
VQLRPGVDREVAVLFAANPLIAESRLSEFAAQPPSSAAYVGGGAISGSEDADGKLILPVPVKIKQDSKFQQFEKQVQAMSEADADYEKQHPGKFIDHYVTATFAGRIDSVA